MIIHSPTKFKGKKKWASADAKRKDAELQAEWQAFLDKNKPTMKSIKRVPYKPPKTYVRDLPQYPSHITTLPATCTKPVEGKVYTGDKMIGIGTLHKSNAVPIFSQEEAKDQATMRR
jgi:hypothetical protein